MGAEVRDGRRDQCRTARMAWTRSGASLADRSRNRARSSSLLGVVSEGAVKSDGSVNSAIGKGACRDGGPLSRVGKLSLTSDVMTGNGGGVSAGALPDGGTRTPVRRAFTRAISFAFSRAFARSLATAVSWSAWVLRGPIPLPVDSGATDGGGGVEAVSASASAPCGSADGLDDAPLASA